MARQFASLDHLSGRPGRVERGHLLGRVHRRELPPRRVPAPGGPLRAGPDVPGHGAASCSTPGPATRSSPTGTPGCSWPTRPRARSPITTRTSTSAGQFNVPRSPQGRPVIFQAGDSDEGREFAASSADAIFSRHATLEAGQAFYADVKGRLARHGRSRDELLILPAATFVLADTDAEAAELAREVRLQQVSGQTAIKFAEQLWNRDLSGYDPDGPLPEIDPDPGENTIARGRASVRMYRDPVATARQWREKAAAEGPVAAGADHRGDRPAVVHRLARHRGRDDQRLRAGRRQRRVHPGPAHHPRRPGRVRRHGGAAAAGARGVPDRVRRHHAARAPRPGRAGPAASPGRDRAAS